MSGGGGTVSWKLQDFTAHKEDVSCLCLGQKTAKIMATGSVDNSVNIWSVNKPHRIMNLTGQTSPITSVNFNTSDELLLAGSQAGIMKMWDLQAAKIIRTMSCHKSAVRAFAFHPYADVLATGAADSSLKLWDLRRKGMLYHFKWHKNSVNSLAFSPDGMWLASTSEDGTSKLTELKTGSLIADFKEHSGPVKSGVFHPNDFLYATGSVDKTVKFWDLETFQMIGSSQPESQPVKCIHFEQEGKFLFSATDNSLKLYTWEPNTQHIDSLVTGWGNVGAIGQISKQIGEHLRSFLIVANFSKTNVSTHVVDFERLGSQVPNGSAEPSTPAGQQPVESPLSPQNYSSAGSRKNFAKEKKPENSVNSVENDDEDRVAQVQIENEDDYQAIFNPKQKLATRTKRRNRSPSRDSQMFRPPADPSGASNVPASKPSNAKLEPNRPHTSCRSVSPKEGERKHGSPSSADQNGYGGPQGGVNYGGPPGGGKVEKKGSVRQQNNAGISGQQAQQKNEFDSSLIAEFDQKIKVNNAQMDMDDRQDVASVLEHVFSRNCRGHETVRDTLADRMRKLETVRGLLMSSTADPFISWKRASDDAVAFCDQSVTNDILWVINSKQSVWSLDLMCSMLPAVIELCKSRHPPYVSNGLAALKIGVRLFGNLIKQSVQSDVNGIDISQEERKKKCDKCYRVIMSFLPELQEKSTSSDRDMQPVYREVVYLISSKL
ncbi:katanin p80 WD40 repeat-containing subunit B1-like isoform X3 [Convolutriloba macropyga]|uniref:katanin p80 WD40 repeat-containing subunit B1-like isoform X3 n=1 Tax=Convolutriloba macropyga TaxID=536237 RepID=UPI003F5227DD